MIYLDTSFLAPLFRTEATSEKIEAFISRQTTGTLAISKWTTVEFASLVSRDVRMGSLTPAQGRQSIAAFSATVAAAFEIFTPGSRDFELAQEYVADFPTQLRGPDALHLAVVYNNGAEFIATLDDGMIAAAKKLKIPARKVIRLS